MKTVQQALGDAMASYHAMLPWVLPVQASHDAFVRWGDAQKDTALALLEYVEPPEAGWDGYGVDPGLELEDLPYKFDSMYVDDAGIGILRRHFHGPAPNGANYTGIGLGGGYSPHKDDTLVEDCLISHTKKWGMRNYSMRRGNVVRRVTFRDCQDEHAIYLNPAGFGADFWTNAPNPFIPEHCVLIDHCLFDDIHSQAIQFRQPEGKPEKTAGGADDWTPGGALIVRDCLARNISQVGVGGRPSFAFSFQRSRNPVLLERVTLDNSMQEQSRGAVLVEGYEEPEGAVGHYPREAILRDCSFTLGHAQQSVGKFTDLASLTIENCHFEATGGNTWLSIEGCEKVVVKDCTGNVRIHVTDGASEWDGPIEGGYDHG